MGEEYRIRGSLYFDLDPVLYQLLKVVNDRTHHFEGLVPGVFHFDDSRRGIAFFEDILFFFSKYAKNLQGHVAVTGGYLNLDEFYVYKPVNHVMKRFHYDALSARTPLKKESFLKILSTQSLYDYNVTSRLSSPEIYQYLNERTANNSISHQPIINWLENFDDPMSTIRLQFETCQIGLSQQNYMYTSKYKIKENSLEIESSKYSHLEFYNNDIDLSESRKIIYDEIEFPLCEVLMMKRNNRLDVVPSEACIILPDGSTSDVCSQCVHRMRKVFNDGCVSCKPSKTKI